MRMPSTSSSSPSVHKESGSAVHGSGGASNLTTPHSSVVLGAPGATGPRSSMVAGSPTGSPTGNNSPISAHSSMNVTTAQTTLNATQAANASSAGASGNAHTSVNMSSSPESNASNGKHLQTRPSKANMSANASGNPKGNKFDPDFHTQRAKALQPLLTALCDRSDVFGLTKFMRWLHFEKSKDIPLLDLFQRSLQLTLDHYQITEPIYSNNMVDALTWLMYLRIEPIWEKVKKGIAFFAVRAVQDIILKAIRPLDDMIMQLNTVSTHIHSVLKLHPNQLLRPLDKLDDPIISHYRTTFAAYDPPVRSLASVIYEEMNSPLMSIATAITNKMASIANLSFKNIVNGDDEYSVTALVYETNTLFSDCSDMLLPQLSNALVALHNNLASKFNSPALQASFSAISEIASVTPRLIDVLLPQQLMMNHFLTTLKLRNAVEALEANLTHNTLCALLNELETEFERSAEKVEIALAVKGRTMHAAVQKLANASAALAEPLGDAVCAFGRMWAKYIRMFARTSSDLLSAQLYCTVPSSWSASVRECLVIAMSRANDYFTRKSLSIAKKLMQQSLTVLFEPLLQSLVAQMGTVLLDPITGTLGTLMVPSPTPGVAIGTNGASNTFTTSNLANQGVAGSNGDVAANTNGAMDVPLSFFLESQVYLYEKTKQLFSDSISSILQDTLFAPLAENWKAVDLPLNLESKNRQARLEGTLLRLMSELQKAEMDYRIRRDSFLLEDRRATMPANFISSAVTLPPAGMMATSNTPGSAIQALSGANENPFAGQESAEVSNSAASVHTIRPRGTTVNQGPPSFSESPVARMLGRIVEVPSSTTSSHQPSAQASSTGDSQSWANPASSSQSHHQQHLREGTAPSSNLNDKKLGKDLVMLSRISVQGGAKIEDEESAKNGPAVSLDFDVNQRSPRTEETYSSASNVWAAASESRAMYGTKRTTRVYYDVPEDPPISTLSAPATSGPSGTAASSVSGATTSNTSQTPGETPLRDDASNKTSTESPTAPRPVPRKPTLQGRPSRGSSRISAVPGSIPPTTAPQQPAQPPPVAIQQASSPPPLQTTPPPFATPAVTETVDRSRSGSHKFPTPPPSTGHHAIPTLQTATQNISEPSAASHASNVPTLPDSAKYKSAWTSSTVPSSPKSTLSTPAAPTSPRVVPPADHIPPVALASSTPLFTIPGASIRIKPTVSPPPAEGDQSQPR